MTRLTNEELDIYKNALILFYMNPTNIYLYTSAIVFLFLFGIWSKNGGQNMFVKLFLLILGVAGLYVAIKG